MTKIDHRQFDVEDPAFRYRTAMSLYRQNLTYFAMRAFSELHGVDVDMNWHIEAICHQLQRVEAGACKRLMIAMPPRYLKSFLSSIILPAWLLGRNPRTKIMCASYSSQLAEEFSAQTLKLMQSPLYQEIFPGTRISQNKRSKTEFKTTRGGGRLATSVGGAVTGRGADYIIVDDLLKAGDAYSDAMRTSANEWFKSTLYTRFNNPKTGAMVVVAQRLHAEDLIGMLSEQGGWDELILPLEFREDTVIEIGDGERYVAEAGTLLQPTRHSRSEIDQLRRDMGERDFEAQYNQSPEPPNGALFKRSWIQRFNLDDVPDPRVFDGVYQSWDTAYNVEAQHDYSVCTTWGVHQGKLYLLHVLRARLAFPDLKRAVMSQKKKWHPKLVIVEAVGSGRSLYQDIWQEYDSPIWLKGVHPEGAKESRAAKQTIKFEHGDIFFPGQADWLSDLEKELFSFPSVKHDDQVDSIVQFLTAADAWGLHGRGGAQIRVRR